MDLQLARGLRRAAACSCARIAGARSRRPEICRKATQKSTLPRARLSAGAARRRRSDILVARSALLLKLTRNVYRTQIDPTNIRIELSVLFRMPYWRVRNDGHVLSAFAI
jgi:hypothetical protein